jgi:hypothetical protein
LFALYAYSRQSYFMASHPNRNWKRRWIVDHGAGTAVHESGLTARLHRHPSGDWLVETENGPQTVAALIEAGERRASERVERWTWEATELFRRASERQERKDG